MWNERKKKSRDSSQRLNNWLPKIRNPTTIHYVLKCDLSIYLFYIRGKSHLKNSWTVVWVCQIMPMKREIHTHTQRKKYEPRIWNRERERDRIGNGKRKHHTQMTLNFQIFEELFIFGKCAIVLLHPHVHRRIVNGRWWIVKVDIYYVYVWDSFLYTTFLYSPNDCGLYAESRVYR